MFHAEAVVVCDTSILSITRRASHPAATKISGRAGPPRRSRVGDRAGSEADGFDVYRNERTLPAQDHRPDTRAWRAGRSGRGLGRPSGRHRAAHTTRSAIAKTRFEDSARTFKRRSRRQVGGRHDRPDEPDARV